MNARKVMVIAVHPDDETIGAGGSLLKHKKNGDELHWVICAEMTSDAGFSSGSIDRREAEIEKVSGMFGFEGVHRPGFASMLLDTYGTRDVVGKISDIMLRVRPEIVYLPFKGDVHSDHRVIFNAAYSCTKSFRYPFIKKIMMMETPSETDFAPSTVDNFFMPNVFVDISEFMDEKIKIMKIYESELGSHPFPRSEVNISALATFRGSAAGCQYAESFVLLKEIL